MSCSHTCLLLSASVSAKLCDSLQWITPQFVPEDVCKVTCGDATLHVRGSVYLSFFLFSFFFSFPPLFTSLFSKNKV